ncbi:SDR family NAD(P)-dependent oxidoreductase [Nocardia asteroides]|uniref:SDR family NAD(P)-dependent oxidoreductase n=1 Tax=Nocardia asteroides TaxID=1824 RepID=UPI0033D50C4C
MHIEGSVALITGGASGLGLGVARMIAARGGQAMIADLPTSRGHEVAVELGDSVAFIPTDVADPDQVTTAVQATLALFGRLDLCVNCAGISPAHRVVKRDGTLFPLDTFTSTVAVNLTGLFDVVRNAAGAMAKNPPGTDGERGLIVNVASIAALEGQVGQAAYAASKGGVVALTLPLARDLAGLGIRVMTVCPGIMDTAMLADADDTRRQALLDIHVFPKRLGRSDDFADLVAAFMTNTMLNGDVVRLDAATRLA